MTQITNILKKYTQKFQKGGYIKKLQSGKSVTLYNPNIENRYVNKAGWYGSNVDLKGNRVKTEFAEIREPFNFLRPLQKSLQKTYLNINTNKDSTFTVSNPREGLEYKFKKGATSPENWRQLLDNWNLLKNR